LGWRKEEEEEERGRRRNALIYITVDKINK
jgi:hypothetical protein